MKDNREQNRDENILETSDDQHRILIERLKLFLKWNELRKTHADRFKVPDYKIKGYKI